MKLAEDGKRLAREASSQTRRVRRARMEPRRHRAVECHFAACTRHVEGGEKLLDVSLDVEEIERLRLAMHAGVARRTGGDEGKRVVLIDSLALHGIDVSGFKEAHVGVAAIQVVGHLRQ